MGASVSGSVNSWGTIQRIPARINASVPFTTRDHVRHDPREPTAGTRRAGGARFADAWRLSRRQRNRRKCPDNTMARYGQLGSRTRTKLSLRALRLKW